MTELTIQEAAEYIGMSVDDIMRSRQRGLPPGILGHAAGGQVYFDAADLIPVKAPTRKQLLQSEAETLGIGFSAKTTIAELEELIELAREVAAEEPPPPGGTDA